MSHIYKKVGLKVLGGTLGGIVSEISDLVTVWLPLLLLLKFLRLIMIHRRVPTELASL